MAQDARGDFDIHDSDRQGFDGTLSNSTKKRSASQGTLGRTKVKMVQCRVIMLDRENYEVEIPKTAIGQELFDNVREHLNLEEADFFSLSYIKLQGTRFWLNMEKKIDKQLANNPWVFSFEVKFYPPEPLILSLDATRYQLVLQVRADILSGRLPCSFHTHALLGSYTIQSEVGDYNPAEHGRTIDYLRQYLFAPNQSEELLYRINELHQLHKGILPAEADLMFMESAKKLALYGVDLHKTKELRDGKESGARDVLVGVSAAGLYIYDDRVRMDTFKWPRIIKISYKRNIFHVKVRSLEYDKEEIAHSFKCTTPKLAKRLWRITVETHQFFRLKQPELTDTSKFSGFGTRRWRMSGRTLHEMKKQGATGNTMNRTGTIGSTRGREALVQQSTGTDSSGNTLDFSNSSLGRGVDGHNMSANTPDQFIKSVDGSGGQNDYIGDTSMSRFGGAGAYGPGGEKRYAPDDKGRYDSEDDIHRQGVIEYDLAHGQMPDTPGSTFDRTGSYGYPPGSHDDFNSTIGSNASALGSELAGANSYPGGAGIVPMPFFARESLGVTATGLLDGTDAPQIERSEKFATERDGHIEKRATNRITVFKNDAENLDNDQALLAAIQSVLNLDLNFTVEKIEIKTESNA